MASATVERELTHEQVDRNDDYSVRGVWTCNNPELPDGKEHEMATSEADTLAELADEFTVHYHGNCMRCEGHHDHYEGSLDRVEVLGPGEELVDIVDPAILVRDYGMEDDMGEVEA